jgi:hypothetical protein
MYRVIAIVSGGLVLSACSSMSDYLKPTPAVDSVRFESDPPGAEARISSGQMCLTPCTISVPVDAPLTVTFNLGGYEPRSETIEGVNSLMQPNPVKVALVRLAPVAVKPVKKTIVKRVAPKNRPVAVTPAAPSAPVPATPAAPTLSTPPPETAQPPTR